MILRMQEPFRNLFSANPPYLDKLVAQRRLVMETLEDTGEHFIKSMFTHALT